MSFTIKAYGLTDVGCVRTQNEDHFLLTKLDRTMNVGLAGGSYERHSESLEADIANDCAGQLLMVADGVGGAPGGEVASRTTLDVIARELIHNAPRVEGGSEDLPEIGAGLRHAVHLAECELQSVERRKPALTGMATTLTMALIIDRHLYVAHVGDSRAYLLRDGQLRRLTRDHTLRQSVLDRFGTGLAANSPLAKHLWNVVGGGVSEAAPDVTWTPIEHGDRLLLCTDGLTHTCTDSQLSRILQDEADVAECVHRLVLRAKGDGGTDNITAVLADFRFDADAAAATQTVLIEQPESASTAETVLDLR